MSRSVFELEFRKNGKYKAAGTGWLIAPKYVATAAHNIKENEIPYIHTFDGEIIEAKAVYHDPQEIRGTDLALLELKREIDAVPMKIAESGPEGGEILMAMGYANDSRGLGGWIVTAGPALGYNFEEFADFDPPNRVYNAVPTSGGMSGGPIFNRNGEVISIVSSGSNDSHHKRRFGIKRFEGPALPKKLWIYGFSQISSTSYNRGPNPTELRELYGKVSDLDEPENAGEYHENNLWKRTDNEFGNTYSPFPVDQFSNMQEVYLRAREGVVTLSLDRAVDGVVRKVNGSGFIYDHNTVITAGHLGFSEGKKAVIRTIDGRTHGGTVIKTQGDNDPFQCDIAIVRTEKPGALSGYRKLQIGDSSSLQCGDPVVQIGSGGLYNSVGLPQGLGVVYMRTKGNLSEFYSPSTSGGMSGGPVVDSEGKVIALSTAVFGRPSDKWEEPAPLIIHTRIPIYGKQDASHGPNSEAIRRFIEDRNFYCQ